VGAKESRLGGFKANRALKKKDLIHEQRLAETAEKHTSEAFYAFDDPLEAAIFSVLIELMKKQEKRDVDI
jgi:hypothetical protein